MKLIILGSGTFIPELKRHCSSYLLKIGKQNLIFDFGRGTLDQLLKIGLHYYQIDKIFISHLHPDHCSELLPFLHVALIYPPLKKTITLYGPKGIKKVINRLLDDFDIREYCVNKLKIAELKEANKIKKKNWTVKSYIVKHSKNLTCLAYRLESNRKIFAYSGDTQDCLGLRKACKNADLAIIEASLDKPRGSTGHMSGEEVGKIAQELKVKKLVLTHISPFYLSKVKKIVKKFYKGQVFVAKDLMRIKI